MLFVKTLNSWVRQIAIVPFLALGLLILGVGFGSGLLQPTVKVVPEPAVDVLPVTKSAQVSQRAVFSGGCFWGMEAIFEEVRGVKSVQTGYSGGDRRTATYTAVSSGTTNHAEAIEIVYDPQQISYGQLLKIFFAVGHDPTQVNRQGVDVGRQYRSAIFADTAEQKQVAQNYIAQLQSAQVFSQPIVTEVNSLESFYPAEDYHQDFVQNHPAHPYVLVHDLPKLQRFRQAFAEFLKPRDS
jgi:peptide-methionine (S)-S-oxide reductase